MTGYYSEKQSNYLIESGHSPVGYLVYLTPAGEYAIVTCVGNSPPNWPDAVEVGPVTTGLYFGKGYPYDCALIEDKEKFSKAHEKFMQERMVRNG
jgi:hypothetical protein